MMTTHSFFQGLKKAVFGLLIWVGVASQIIESGGIFNTESLNSWFPGLYIPLLILYVVIDAFYQRKKLTTKSNSLMYFNRTQIIIGTLLMIIIGAILHQVFQPTIYVGTLALAVMFFIVWLLEGRRHNFLGFLSLGLMIIALLPLLSFNEKYAWILPSFFVGLILIVAGIIDHLALTHQPNEFQS